jgi:hypothetical protein|tara:strand:- start:740 stop:1339 length:600 start_codon:yes stop_codon:yes gene_type:complete
MKTIKRTTLAIATLLTYVSVSGGIVYADEIENELSAIKARLQQLENQVDKQNDMIRSQQDIIENKSKQIEALAESTQANQKTVSNKGWFNKVEISGLVEVGIAAEVNDWVTSEIILLYDEDETDLEMDVATVTITNPNGAGYLSGGQMYVPFGVFESNLISDPLTLDIGRCVNQLCLQVKKPMFLPAVYTYLTGLRSRR